jgi:hypothetical protein
MGSRVHHGTHTRRRPCSKAAGEKGGIGSVSDMGGWVGGEGGYDEWGGG